MSRHDRNFGRISYLERQRARRLRRRFGQSVALVIGGGLFGLLAVGSSNDPGESAPMTHLMPGADRSAERIFGNCREAREAGAAPMQRGEPGYRPALDRDGDGVACEPYSGGY